jgi:hypothetical protein
MEQLQLVGRRRLEIIKVPLSSETVAVAEPVLAQVQQRQLLVVLVGQS